MKKLFIIILSLALLWTGWYLLSPLFIDDIVNEDIPIPILLPLDVPDIQESYIYDVPADIILDHDIVMDEPMMENPESFILKKGAFNGADDFHKGSGDLLVISDGEKTFLRFENFSVSNGPDLYVTVNKRTDAKSEHIILEKLKGNKGSQNYDVSNINLAEYQSVSIYCKAFSVVFATAQL